MGFEEISHVFNSIGSVLTNAKGMASILAWLGVALIIIVIVYYLALGITKALRAFLNMKVKYLGIFTLLLGLMLLAIATILP